MHTLANIFIGLVAIMTFVIVLRVLGWLARKTDIVQGDTDSYTDFGVGCGLLVVILAFLTICWIVGISIDLITTR